MIPGVGGGGYGFFEKKKIAHEKCDEKIVCSANCKQYKVCSQNWQKNGVIYTHRGRNLLLRSLNCLSRGWEEKKGYLVRRKKKSLHRGQKTRSTPPRIIICSAPYGVCHSLTPLVWVQKLPRLLPQSPIGNTCWGTTTATEMQQLSGPAVTCCTRSVSQSKVKEMLTCLVKGCSKSEKKKKKKVKDLRIRAFFPQILYGRGGCINWARRQSGFPTLIYILPTPRRQRAAQATTIAPRWQTLWCQHGPFGGTLSRIFGPRIWRGRRTPFIKAHAGVCCR